MQQLLALLTVYLVWSSTYLAIHTVVKEWPPFFFVGIRYLVSGLLLYIILKIFKSKEPTFKEWFNCFLVGAFLFAGGTTCLTWSQKYVPTSVASIGIAAIPLWICLFSIVGWLRMLGTWFILAIIHLQKLRILPMTNGD